MSSIEPYSLQDFSVLQKLVVSAAQNGDLSEIKAIIKRVDKAERTKVVSGRLNNVTPLLGSIRNGHIKVATYLVEKCQVDVEEAGSVSFDGEIIDGAPPLWCAAAAGHTEMVNLLLKNKALINNATITNSTPLRAACFDGRLEIVNILVENGADIEIANRHGHTCLMIACYKNHTDICLYLIDKGADINRRSVKGNTALHDCAESGNLEIMKLLLHKGAAQDVDSYGLSPLHTACVAGHTNIVDHLLEYPENCDKSFEALKLLGATYVDKKRDMAGAIKLWRAAIKEFRSQSNNSSANTSKFAEIKSEFGYVTNLENYQQLNDIIVDPDRIKMQALYIREQILGPVHPDSSYYTRYRGAVYADSGNLKKCISLWEYALKMQQKYLEPLNMMTLSSLASFVELFYFTFLKHPLRHQMNLAENQRIAFDDVLSIFKYAYKEICRGVETMKRISPGDKDSMNMHKVMVMTLNLVHLLSSIKNKDGSDDSHFMKLVYDLIKMDPRGINGTSFLHLACHRQTSEVGRHFACPFPSLDVVKILLTAGANVNATDYDLDRPLHVSVFCKPINDSIVNLLLEHGAHIDAMNLNHDCPLAVLKKDISVNVNVLKYLKLSCLAAQVLSLNGVHYENMIPRKLVDFVKYH